MEIGKTNTLKAARTTDNGCYLMDEAGNEVLLPNAYVSENLKLGDDIDVFVYKDNDQRPVATTLKPKVELEQFAFLEVMDVNNAGAFMDMGVVKQLLVPYAEQTEKMEVGKKYVVFLLLDEETDRLIGSTKIKHILFFDEIEVEEGEAVTILCYRSTDLGMSVIVNNMFQGLVFKTDIHKKVSIGDELKGYVKKIRNDGKIDILLEPMGYRNVIDSVSQQVLDAINKSDGFLKLTDKSDPNEIRRELGLSKKAFKKALGNLYKQKRVLLEKEGTRLVK
ncbi:MAG: GntR family transcriptional regulator [Bacteroidia bacterium]|nr:GntR family transcriptional regulator [Bacteroidia bacterium]